MRITLNSSRLEEVALEVLKAIPEGTSVAQGELRAKVGLHPQDEIQVLTELVFKRILQASDGRLRRAENYEQAVQYLTLSLEKEYT